MRRTTNGDGARRSFYVIKWNFVIGLIHPFNSSPHSTRLSFHEQSGHETSFTWDPLLLARHAVEPGALPYSLLLGSVSFWEALLAEVELSEN